MSSIVAIVQWSEEGPGRAAQEAVSAAATLAGELGWRAEALVLGDEEAAVGAAALGEFGIERVTVAVHEALASYHPDSYPQVISPLIEDSEHRVVMITASSDGRDMAPRLAARLDSPLFQDVTRLRVEDGRVEVERPIHSGKALLRARAETPRFVVTLRKNAFSVRSRPNTPTVEVVRPSLEPDALPTQIVGFEPLADDAPDVSQASIVVSGGRGMKSPEQWGLLEELRSALGPEAGLGASRAVVDAGWRPHSEQVGQTGKTVSPRLYFAVGISGAAQHLAGMRTAGTIVAINRDPDAPIFKIADYGIVGDALEVLPELTEAVRRLKGIDSSPSGPSA